jgi:hypothetical protein
MQWLETSKRTIFLILLKFQNLWNLINILIKKLRKYLLKCFLWFLKVWWVQKIKVWRFLMVPPKKTLTHFTLPTHLNGFKPNSILLLVKFVKRNMLLVKYQLKFPTFIWYFISSFGGYHNTFSSLASRCQIIILFWKIDFSTQKNVFWVFDKNQFK